METSIGRRIDRLRGVARVAGLSSRSYRGQWTRRLAASRGIWISIGIKIDGDRFLRRGGDAPRRQVVRNDRRFRVFASERGRRREFSVGGFTRRSGVFARHARGYVREAVHRSFRFHRRPVRLRSACREISEWTSRPIRMSNIPDGRDLKSNRRGTVRRV